MPPALSNVKPNAATKGKHSIAHPLSVTLSFLLGRIIEFPPHPWYDPHAKSKPESKPEHKKNTNLKPNRTTTTNPTTKEGTAMTSKTTIPLGYVELPDGTKAIYPMNDIFLNYTFENPDYWETLRTAVNLIIESYKSKHPHTKAKPIEGAIKVRTQFKHLLNTDNKTREQDIKITEDE